DGFVLRPAVARIDAVRAVRHLDHPLAADGAGVAGIALLEDFAGHRLAVERPPPLEDATRPVARGQPADILLSLDDLRRAQLAERPALRLGEDLRTVPCQLVQTLAVIQHRPELAAHRDGLEVLAAHHRAHAGAP